MKVINLFAGPGAGKSTMAAQLFAELKWKNQNCELVREWIKEKVWQGNNHSLSNQIYVFAKQQNGMFLLKDKVDYIITDSPLLLSIMYNPDKDEGSYFQNLVLREFARYDNLNYFIRRKKHYNPAGRYQTSEEALDLDNKIKLTILDKFSIPYVEIDGNKEGLEFILKDLGIKND